MIQANDLRINNLVLYRGEVSVVKGVLKTSVDLLVDPCVRFTKMALLENIEPIYLTEEWLVKFGGQITCFSNGVTIERFRFIWNDSYKYWYVVDKNEETYLTKIETVHELQNFYAAMNGQELTIKL